MIRLNNEFFILLIITFLAMCLWMQTSVTLLQTSKYYFISVQARKNPVHGDCVVIAEDIFVDV